MNLLRRSRDLDDRVVETLLSGHTPSARPDLGALAELLQEARAAAPPEGPTPSERLAAIFDKGVVPVVVPLRSGPLISPQRRSPAGPAWRVALLGIAAVAGVLLAAEGNTLPAPAQTAVADVVEALTPLTIPRPATPVVGNMPAPVVPSAPAPAHVGPATHPPAPRPKPQRATSPRPTASPRLVGPDVVILPPLESSQDPTPAAEPDPSDSPAP